jgi:hypothetical protein
MLSCTCCNKTQPEDQFYKTRTKRGYTYKCKTCQAQYGKTHHRNTYVKKTLKCLQCGLTKPVAEFSGLGSLSVPLCRACLKRAGKRVCSHCHKVLDYDQFYGEGRGRSNCKICMKGLQRESLNRIGKHTIKRRMDALRADPVKGPAYKDKQARRQVSYRLGHWCEIHARWYIDKLKRLKIISPPEHCQYCGSDDGYVECHHHLGYKPAHWTDVHWLCHECHNATRRDGYVEKTLKAEEI